MYFELQGGLQARELARGWLKEHATAEQLAFLLPQTSPWDAPLDVPTIAEPPAPIPAAGPARPGPVSARGRWRKTRAKTPT